MSSWEEDGRYTDVCVGCRDASKPHREVWEVWELVMVIPPPWVCAVALMVEVEGLGVERAEEPLMLLPLLLLPLEECPRSICSAGEEGMDRMEEEG